MYEVGIQRLRGRGLDYNCQVLEERAKEWRNAMPAVETQFPSKETIITECVVSKQCFQKTMRGLVYGMFCYSDVD